MLTDDERYPPFTNEQYEALREWLPLHGWNEWNEEFDPSSSDDEDDDDIAQHKRLFQGIGGFRNEEVVDETSDDEETDDEEFEEAIRREEALMNGFAFYFHLALLGQD